MKRHILNKFATTYNYLNKCSSYYYDELTQVSYYDEDYNIKVISQHNHSGLTETIETSDPDEFDYSKSTKSTFTIENSDNDEFVMNSTIKTAIVEDSDPDEFNFIESTMETRVIENSDPDEFYLT